MWRRPAERSRSSSVHTCMPRGRWRRTGSRSLRPAVSRDPLRARRSDWARSGREGLWSAPPRVARTLAFVTLKTDRDARAAPLCRRARTPSTGPKRAVAANLRAAAVLPSAIEAGNVEAVGYSLRLAVERRIAMQHEGIVPRHHLARRGGKRL